jgi:hypothetical protein
MNEREAAVREQRFPDPTKGNSDRLTFADFDSNPHRTAS